MTQSGAAHVVRRFYRKPFSHVIGGCNDCRYVSRDSDCASGSRDAARRVGVVCRHAYLDGSSSAFSHAAVDWYGRTVRGPFDLHGPCHAVLPLWCILAVFVTLGLAQHAISTKTYEDFTGAAPTLYREIVHDRLWGAAAAHLLAPLEGRWDGPLERSARFVCLITPLVLWLGIFQVSTARPPLSAKFRSFPTDVAAAVLALTRAVRVSQAASTTMLYVTTHVWASSMAAVVPSISHPPWWAQKYATSKPSRAGECRQHAVAGGGRNGTRPVCAPGSLAGRAAFCDHRLRGGDRLRGTRT